MTPYNARAGLQSAARAGKHLLKDPGDGGTINATPGDPAVCLIEGGSTRVMDAATRYPLGTEVMIVCQTTSITVSTVSPANLVLADGEYAVLRVSRNSSGANEWVSPGNSNESGVIPASAGTYEFLNTETAADNLAGLLTILTALQTAGLIDATGITQATS